MPRQNIAPLSTILIVTVLIVSLVGVGFASSPVAAQSTPNDADAYLEDGGTYTQGQTLYRDDLESYELMTLHNEDTGEEVYTRRANSNGEFYIPTEFNPPGTYRLEGQQSGTIATYTLEPGSSNSDGDNGGTSQTIVFDDYYGDGDPVTEVTVQEATLNEGGFLAVYKNGQYVAASDDLSEGTHQDVTIDISSDPVTDLSTIRIAPFKDSNNNGQFDSNDESYWGEDSAQSVLAQYGPEEVPPTEPWGTPNDGDDPDEDPNNNDDDGVFTPGGEDPNEGEDNSGDNPEGNLPSVPAFLTNPIFLIGGVVLIVFLILGGLIARHVLGGTGFEDYEPEEEETGTEQDPTTTASDSEDGTPDPARVDGTTGPTPTQDGPPGAGTTASDGDSAEEKGFGGVTPQEDLPTPVREDEEDSIQPTADDSEEPEEEEETEEESEPEPEPEEEDIEPPTPLGDDEEETDAEETSTEMSSETDSEVVEEEDSEEDVEVEDDEPEDDVEEQEEVDEGYGPEPDEEIPPQPGMEDEFTEEINEDDSEDAVESELEPEPEPETESEPDEEDVEEQDMEGKPFDEQDVKEEQVPDEPSVEDDTTSPSVEYDSTKDPMYGEDADDTPPAPLHEAPEEEDEVSEDAVESEPEPEPEPEVDDETDDTQEEEDDGGLGFFGRLRSGLTPDSPSSEEVPSEDKPDDSEEPASEEPEDTSEDSDSEDDDGSDVLEDVVAEREVEDDEDDDDDEEPSATTLVDGGEDDDDDPFSNV